MTTMIADPPRSTTRLGVGLDADRRRSPNADAWKTAIGTKPIAARLALLPDSKPRWSRIGVSAGVQLTILIFCVLIPLLYPDQLKTALNFRKCRDSFTLDGDSAATATPATSEGGEKRKCRRLRRSRLWWNL